MNNKLDELVKKYVDEKDIHSVRFALTGLGYIGDKDSYIKFISSTEYAKEKLDELFQEDDGVEIPRDLSLISYKEVISLMMENFSEIKFNEALHIGSKLFVNKEQDEKRSYMNENTKESGKEKNPFLKIISRHPVGAVIAIIAMILVVFLVRQIMKNC